MTGFLSTGIRALDLGGLVPETMQAAASESSWEERMKRIWQTPREIERKLRKRPARRHRLPVLEDVEAGWWRRRRRSSTVLWIPEFPALPKIK